MEFTLFGSKVYPLPVPLNAFRSQSASRAESPYFVNPPSLSVERVKVTLR